MLTWLLAAIVYVLIGGVVVGFIEKRNAKRHRYDCPFPPELDECWPLVGGIIIWPILVAIEAGSFLFSATNRELQEKK